MNPIAHALITAYNAHDPDAVAACYRADATHVDVASGRPKTGPEAIASGLGYLIGSFPDAAWEVVGAADDDDVVALRYRLTGTLRRPFGPYSPGGQRLALPGVLWLELDDRVVAHSTDFWDSATFARQMQASQQIRVAEEGTNP